MKKTEQYATRIKQLIEAIYRSNKKEILVISDENMYWKIGRQWGNFSEIERMLEEITKGIRENGIMKIDIQDTNAFSIREDIVQVSGNYEVIYVAGYGQRRLVYNIVATYYREQITYLQILEMGKYHSTSYRVKAVNEDYYKIAENEILYLEANHNHVVWNCINGKIVALDSTPKTFQIAYPMFDSDGKVVNKKMDIPQICLLPMSSLKLDEVEVDFKVKLYGGVKLKTERNHEEEPEKGDMQHSANLLKASKKEEDEDSGTFIGYFPQGYSRKNKDENYANIRLKFVSDEPPEGLMRIQEQYTKITL